MPDVKTSDLTAIDAATTLDTDLIEISDLSESESKKMTVAEAKILFRPIPEYGFSKPSATKPTATGAVSTSTTNLVQFVATDQVSSSGVTFNTTDRRIDLDAGIWEIEVMLQVSGSTNDSNGGLRLHDGTAFFGSEGNPICVGHSADLTSADVFTVIHESPSSSSSVYIQFVADVNITGFIQNNSYIKVFKKG